MAASEEAYGADHPATYSQQPSSSKHKAQLSGLAHGEDEASGFSIEEKDKSEHDFDPDH